MESVKVIIQKLVAVLTVFIIIMSQYVITGLIETTYAIDLLATQSDNVQFRAYFKNGEEELTEIESSINAKDLRLKIDVAVKNQGYFNGKISLDNAGFKIKQATANDYIREVKDNIIYLNQINAEETASIEVGIEYLDEDKIPVYSLSEPSTVKLTGIYTSSGGNVTIDSGSNVKVTWKIPEGTKAELASIVQTNSIYKVEEENKRIIQFLISSKLSNNAYPIKNTEIKATIPEGVTKVKVHKRTTRSTNGEQEFLETNYSTEGNILTISVNNNEEEGKISWMKGVQDIYVVTYEYPESSDLNTQNITINEKITAQNNVELNAEPVQIALNQEIDGIVRVSKFESESEIYKGKIYSGEARDITSYTIAYVDYVDGVKEIEIAENEAKYAKEVEENGITNTIESNANVEIKSVKINKEKVESVLGNTWTLTIGETQVTNETPTDENGDILVQLSEGTKALTIKTSKPEKNGSFVIETIKSIKNTTNTREEKKEFTILRDSSSIKYTKNNDDEFTFTSSYKIGLKETMSKVRFETNIEALTSEEINKNVKFTVTLLNNNESRDLYKNPKIKIILPKQVANVTITDSNLRFSNELNIKETKVITENNNKVIYVDIEGTQNVYNTESIEGTTLIINCNIEIAPEAKTANEEFILNYTNEFASIYEDNGQQKVPVKIYVSENNATINSSGEIGNSNFFAELKAYVGEDEIKPGDKVKAGEIVQYVLNIKNNSLNEDIDNLGLNISIPEEASLIEYNPEYPRQNPEQDGAYYADGEFFVKKQNKTLTVHGINVQAGKTYTYKYMVEINPDLIEQKDIGINAIIKKDENTITTLNLQNKIIPSNLKVSIRPLFRKYGDELEAERNYEYKIEVQNLTNTEQKNVKVKIIKNNVVTITKIDWFINGETEENNSEDENFETEKDIADNTQDEVIIDKIPANKKAEIVINTINTQNSDDIVYAQMFAKAYDISNNTYRTNKLVEIIKGLRIQATLEKQVTTKQSNGFVESGDTIKYIIKIKNTGYIDAEKLEIEDYFSKYLELKSLKLNGNIYEYNIQPMVDEAYNYNIIKIEAPLNSKDEATIEIVGEVSDILPDVQSLQLTNNVVIYGNGIKLVKTEEITDTIKQEESEDNKDEKDNNTDDNNNNNNDNNNNDNNNSEEENTQKSKNVISGVAWLDENENGRREENENLLNNIQVILLNLDSKKTQSTKTQENGNYIFYNIENGKYLVIFEYDTGKYVLTTYNANGVDTSRNSDVENITMIINGVKKIVASTDTLTLKDDSLTNIDIGLKKSKIFDLELDKTITKITIINSSGTKVNKYKNVNLAKAEIRAKDINGSIVKIEYKIKVTNRGEIAGYAKQIVDYKPNDLEFNFKENPKWEKSGKNLYTKSLANTIINPGESKEVTLILTKKMTNTNTGLTNNMAEIAEYYNAYGVTDIDSTPNNKQGNEDDLGQANAIISISTGKTISYMIITLLVTIGIGIFTYINLKKYICKRLNF